MSYQIIKLESVDSTNIYLSELARMNKLPARTVVWALNQTEGRGQYQRSWYSEPGKNLTLSVLIRPLRFKIENTFYISAVAALALAEAIRDLLKSEVKIKWPNDVLINGIKAGGILIENAIQGDELIHSVLGFGLNVNQEKFDYHLKATSLKLETGKDYELEKIVHRLLDFLERRLIQLECRQYKSIIDEYNKILFKLNVVQPFSRGDELFDAIVEGVTNDGRLTLNHKNKIEKYRHGSIRFADF